MSTWDVDGGTAVGPSVAVVADDALIAVVTALWDDETGVRVSLVGDDGLDDLTAAQALALADVIRDAAMVSPPQ